MKDSRVIDFVNTVRLLHSFFSCIMYWTSWDSHLHVEIMVLGMHSSVQKIGFWRVCGFRHQCVSDGSSGDLGAACPPCVRAIRQGGQPAYHDRRTCIGIYESCCTLNRLLTKSLDTLLIPASFAASGTRPRPLSAPPRCSPGLDQARRREAQLPRIHQALARSFFPVDPESLRQKPFLQQPNRYKWWRSHRQSLAGVCVCDCLRWLEEDGSEPKSKRNQPTVLCKR